MGLAIAYIHTIHDKQAAMALVVGEDVESTSNDSERSIASMTRVRDSMLDMIVERTHDVNAFTRAAVLKVWSSLLESKSIPHKRVGAVAEIAVDRLFDKTAAVRKAAVCLLTTLLDYNPFSSTLDINQFKKSEADLIVTYNARVQQLYSEEHGSGSDTVLSALDDIKTSAENLNLGKPLSESEEHQIAKEVAEEEMKAFIDSDLVKGDSEIIAITSQQEFIHAALEFLKAIELAIPKILEMIASKVSGDVIEAMRFFAKAVNFNVRGSAKCQRSTFSLIWHQDDAIKTECLMSFQNVFLTDGGAGTDAKPLPPAEIAMNLVTLVQRCGVSEMASLEKIIGELFKQKKVEGGIVHYLCSILIHY